MTKASERGTDKKIIQKITELDAAWGKAATAHDLEGVVSFYAPNGSLVWPGMKAVHGTAAIHDSWAMMYKTYAGLGLKFTPERIDVAEAGDLAIDFGSVELTQDTDEGPQTEIDKYLVVWQKVQGEWKVLYDSYNTNV